MATDIDWPEYLPQNARYSNFSYTPNDNIIETSMSTGYSKRRPRFTKTYKIYEVSFEVTKEQLYYFTVFFEYDLGYGVLNFNLPDPIHPSSTIECRIVSGSDTKPYKVTPLSESEDLILSFTTEVL